MKRKRSTTELIHEGEFVAEVQVELVERENDDWAPYFSLSEAQKLDDVRDALRRGDLATAEKFGRIFRLVPVHS
jgi:hypothetical protein